VHTPALFFFALFFLDFCKVSQIADAEHQVDSADQQKDNTDDQTNCIHMFERKLVEPNSEQKNAHADIHARLVNPSDYARLAAPCDGVVECERRR